MASTPAPTTRQRILDALLESSALTVAGLAQLTGQPVHSVQHAVLSLRSQGMVTGKSGLCLTRYGEEYAQRIAQPVHRRYPR